MKRLPVLLAVLAAGALALAPAVAPAQAVDLFLKLDNIKGASIDDQHKDWIDVLSYSLGASNPGSSGQGGGGGGGKVSFSDLSLAKLVDASTPFLLEGVATGKMFKEAILEVVRTGQNPVPFLVYTLEDVLISSYSVSGSSGGGLPTEALSLNFEKIKVEYRKDDKGGKIGSPITFAYDLKTNKGSADVMTPVPEPSTWAMLVAGLLFVVFFGRNRVRGRGLAA
jgi:type VI secretion system secreted protein Hcp